MVARRPIALPAALDFTFDQIQVLWFQVSDFNAFFFHVFFIISIQNSNMTVAIKSITKKNISKSHNLLGKEIKILKVKV